MTDSITPPPELVEKLQDLGNLDAIALAYRAGADQELEACCEWLKAKQWTDPEFAAELRIARRPKPPSLKEQALQAQQRMWDGGSTHEDWQLIRRALEALPE
jgi:hypothetical protein